MSYAVFWFKKAESWSGGGAGRLVRQVVELLRERGRLDWIQLLHFQLRWQMAHIRDIATCVGESA
ncbi:hypothetical protein, partial [Enterobacter intestinihominis]